MTRHFVSAAELGLIACHHCDHVIRAASARLIHCPCCHSVLHRRKPDSMARTWALLLAAGILYLPANLLPFMDTGSLFNSTQDTILSGVIFLWTSGSWPLAILVFVASFMVPLGKLLALSYLLISVQFKHTRFKLFRTRVYAVLELSGRWSMLDIYVVTLLAALVQIESLATVKVGSGAIAFGAVVVLTMLAAMSFDPRLIWDTPENK